MLYHKICTHTQKYNNNNNKSKLFSWFPWKNLQEMCNSLIAKIAQDVALKNSQHALESS